ncbi:MAG: hypothetical protein R3C60_13345 [Parvularculaceae bacterium]
MQEDVRWRDAQFGRKGEFAHGADNERWIVEDGLSARAVAGVLAAAA